MTMKDCPCCLPPWAFRKPIPDPYTHMKINATTAEILYIGDHGAPVSDIDSDGTYFYTGSSSSAVDGTNYRVRKWLCSNGSKVWGVLSAIGVLAVTLGSNGLLIGGTGTTKTHVYIGTGTGTSSGTSSSSDYVLGGGDLQLLDYTNGRVLWTAYLNPDGVTPGTVNGIAIDHSGNVYACGFIAAVVGSGTSATRWCVAKYDSNGHMLWSRVSPQTTTNTTFLAICVNSTSVSVTSSGTTTGGTPKQQLQHLDLNGNLLWSANSPPVWTGIKNADGNAYLSTGEVIVSGVLEHAGTSTGIITFCSICKFGTTETGTATGSLGLGNLIWEIPVEFNLYGATILWDICVDESDNIYVVTAPGFKFTVGVGNSPTGFSIFKFDSNGNAIWAQDYNLQIKNNIGAAFGVAAVKGFVYAAGTRIVL